MVQVVVDRPDGHIQFRVVGDDLVRGLPLEDQGRDDLVLLMELTPGHVDPFLGRGETFPVLPVGEDGIIAVLIGNGAAVDGLGASIAHVRGPVKAVTALLYKITAGLVAGRTGSAFDPADTDLPADVGLRAVVAVDTEVVCIVKSSFVVPVTDPVEADFLGDGGGILTEVLGDLLEGQAVIERMFDVLPVLKGQVFLVTRYISAHRVSFHCCQKAGRRIPPGYERVNSSCAGLNSSVFRNAGIYRCNLRLILK